MNSGSSPEILEKRGGRHGRPADPLPPSLSRPFIHCRRSLLEEDESDEDEDEDEQDPTTTTALPGKSEIPSADELTTTPPPVEPTEDLMPPAPKSGERPLAAERSC